MTYRNLVTDTDSEGIATIAINRPDKLNALNAETIAELGGAFDSVLADESRARTSVSSRRRIRFGRWMSPCTASACSGVWKRAASRLLLRSTALLWAADSS
jgi:hypothetical protein